MQLLKHCQDELNNLAMKEAKKSTKHTVGASKTGKCPANKPLKDMIGVCHSCDDSLPFAMDGKDIDDCTSVCQKKQANRIRNGYFCYKKKCPKDKSILGFNGKCYSCNDKEDKINAIEGYSACSQRYESGFWSEKGAYGRLCSYKNSSKFFSAKDYKKYEDLKKIKCPDNKPILSYSFFEEENGKCYSCYTPKEIDSVYGCDKCSNREITSAQTGNNGMYFECSLKK